MDVDFQHSILQNMRNEELVPELLRQFYNELAKALLNTDNNMDMVFYEIGSFVIRSVKFIVLVNFQISIYY